MRTCIRKGLTWSVWSYGCSIARGSIGLKISLSFMLRLQCQIDQVGPLSMYGYLMLEIFFLFRLELIAYRILGKIFFL